MVKKETIDFINKLLKNKCIFIEHHTGAIVEVRSNSSKVILQESGKLYKAKEIVIKNNKYLVKITCKELDSVIPTTKIFRLDAYRKYTPHD